MPSPIGIDVHGAEGREVTESHHLAIRAAAYGGGQTASKHLAKANILLCGIGLPIEPVAGDLNGIRIGTQEVTRFGMKEDAMRPIARLMARVLIDREDPALVRPDAVAFRKQFPGMAFVR
ncbi:MAG: hypothetical protein U1E67_17305 [Hyphomicrobiales bacterium]